MSVRVSDQGRVRPLVTLSGFLGGSVESGPSGQVPTANGSNQVAWGSNVAIITSNGSNALLGPYVNFANGSNVTFTLDQGPFPQQALPSNTLRIHASGSLDALVTDLTITSPATGQVIGYDGAEWENRQPAPAIVPKAPNIYFSNGGAVTTGAPATQDRLNFAGIYVPSGTIDRIGVWVTAGGAAGAVVRLGLYASNPATMAPGALLVDGGTVSTTGTGFKEVSISTSVGAGLLWIGAAQQVAVCDWVHLGGLGFHAAYIGEVTPSNTLYGGYGQASITGAFPSTATPVLQSIGGNNPRVWIRYSS